MKNIGFPVMISIMLAACGGRGKVSEAEQLAARIDSLETAFFNVEASKGNPKTGMNLIREYAKFYQNNSEDSLAIDRLFKAGEISMGIQQGSLAVKYFRSITEKHSDFYKAPEALFLTGFCEENINADTADARFYYDKFIQTYPDHRLVEDAKFSIANLGRSDEELIRMFEKNLNKQGNP